LDTIGGAVQQDSWALIKKGGMLVSITETPSEEIAKQHGVTGAFVFIEPSSRILGELNALVEANKLTPLIEQRFSLEQIVAAHKQSQSGRTRGKIVIEVS
ncbi:MAG: NADPH:quinone reductase-like Zn-dependent oxidoreductase, partial [Sphingobacteriales bacterium]